MATVVFERVPHPPFIDRPITKPDGGGASYVGRRHVKGVVWHRMLGTLWGTDSYFRFPSTKALTDYGVGVGGVDGNGYDGAIIRWNDPRGMQSGWASGPVKNPYGDGLEFVKKYATNDPIHLEVVNRDQVSIEISGNYETPLTEQAKRSVVNLTAYWADQYHIPYDKWPIAPQDGFSFIRWHQEYCIGDGKVCPGNVVMNATNDMIERVRVILKAYQTQSDTTPPPVKPPPDKWASPVLPVWWTEEELKKGIDRKINETNLYAIHRQITFVKNTKRLAWAGDNAPETGPPFKTGEKAIIEFKFTDDAGRGWLIAHDGSRFRSDAADVMITIRKR